ncbi:putative bifunctional diguanylate cyclase/phosphodiesterase [Endothiovibrio diazotrophicus]
MSVPQGDKRDLEALQARVAYLEETNRWHLFGLDLLLSLREVHNNVWHGRNPAVILRSTREYLERLFPWQTVAFLTVSEEDASFVLFDAFPESDWEWMQQEVDRIIESGEFAWAINQNREVIYQAKLRDCSMVLHVLTTKTRIRGMFIGVPSQPLDSIPEGSLHLLSIILHHSAYVLESAELYHLLSEENLALEATVAERTEELRYQFTHDDLTGLPNRVLFLDRLTQAIKHAELRERRIGVLVLDIDAFKLINDSLGRQWGDEFLKQVGERLAHHITEGNNSAIMPALEEATVARLGVDEFCVLLPAANEVDELADAVLHIQDVVAQPFSIADQMIYATASVGASVYPDDGRNPETLLAQADIAMHHAKAQGKGTYQFYAPKMNAKALDHLTLATQLRQALEREEFVLHYQPQMDITTGRVAGVEALIRWQRSDGRLVPPMEFIPLLEDDRSLIIPAGQWVMEEAARFLNRLGEQGFGDIKVAINLSATQFMDAGLTTQVEEILQFHAIQPHRFELELTESTIMRDVPRAVSMLNGLNELGVQLAIDDFGTGYSSLAHLKRFPLDVLKVDRSFIRDLPGDGDDSAIVRAIMAMAATLNLEVVAEGVETAEQLEFLRGLGGRYIQGFFFSKPLPEEALIAFLNR